MPDEPITQQAPIVGEQPVSAVPTPAAPATPEPSLIDQYELGQGDLEANPPSVAEPAAPVPTQPAPPSVSHPRYLVQQALDLGIPQADINSHSTDDLGTYVAGAMRQLTLAARDNQRAAVTQQALDQPPPSSVPGGVTGDTGRAPATEEEFSLGPNEQDFAPELTGALKRIWGEVSGLKKQLAEAKAKLDGYEQAEQRRTTETLTERADRAFARHETILGKGRRDDLAADSPERARRVAVLTMVSRDNSQATLEAKIDKAVSTLFGAGGSGVQPSSPPVPNTPARKPTRPQRPDGTFMSDAEIAELNLWNGGGLSRPTQRQGAAEPNGVARATLGVASRLRELSSEPESSDDLDQFPE